VTVAEKDTTITIVTAALDHPPASHYWGVLSRQADRQHCGARRSQYLH